MKIDIKKYKIEKVEIESFKFDLPEKTEYYFETNIRRSIRIKPIWTTWQKEQHGKEEEIYEFEITCIYLSSKCKVELFNIYPSDIEKLYYGSEKSMKSDFVNSWVSNYFNKRIEQDFTNDLNVAIEKLQK